MQFIDVLKLFSVTLDAVLSFHKCVTNVVCTYSLHTHVMAHSSAVDLGGS